MAQLMRRARQQRMRPNDVRTAVNRFGCLQSSLGATSCHGYVPRLQVGFRGEAIGFTEVRLRIECR